MNDRIGVHGCGLVSRSMLPLVVAGFTRVVGPAVFTTMVKPAVWAAAYGAVEISAKCEPWVTA